MCARRRCARSRAATWTTSSRSCRDSTRRTRSPPFAQARRALRCDLGAMTAQRRKTGSTMAASGSKPATIDAYIAAFAPEVRAVLEKIRRTVHAAAPAAQETISYGIPAFTLNGTLVGPKGNLRFPLDEPMPYALIE